MKTIIAASLIALGLLVGSNVWTTLNDTAPRSVFDQLQDSAPRSADLDARDKDLVGE